MMDLNSIDPGPYVLKIVHYLLAKQWQVSLRAESYAGILDRECRSLLDVSKLEVAESGLDLMFPIVWNELERNWLRDGPYLVSKAAVDPMRRYMILAEAFRIPGPTSMLFRYVLNPNLLLTVRCGEGERLKTRSELVDGVAFLCAELPRGGMAYDVLRSHWDECNSSVSVPTEFPAIDSVRLGEASMSLTAAQLMTFRDAVRVDVLDIERSRGLQNVLWEAGCRDDARASRGVEELHETLVLLRLLLEHMPHDSELLYCFSAANLLREGGLQRNGGVSSGGCFVHLGPSGFTSGRSWWKYYLLASVATSKLQGVQMFFNRHSERKFALNAATAAIMTRNWAHHYDSHIRPRTKLTDIRNRLVTMHCVEPAQDPNVAIEGAGELYDILAVLRERLDNYISEKAAFIAEVTSEPLTSTKRAMLYRDVIVPLVQNTLFMDNIAANEGLGYRRDDSKESQARGKTHSSMRIRVFRRPGRGDVEPGASTVREFLGLFSCNPGSSNQTIYRYPVDGYPYDDRCCSSASNPHPSHVGDRQFPEHLELSSVVAGCEEGAGEVVTADDPDVEIELPGPLGEHALYGFLENLIRNAAKHSHPSELEVRLSVADSNDYQRARDYYDLDIWDTATLPNMEISHEVNGEAKNSVIDVISAYIKSDLLGPTLQVKPQAWGIAEMKICAAMLSGCTDLERLQEFLSVRVAWETTEGVLVDEAPDCPCFERLVYRLRLMKSRRVCVVSSALIDSRRRETLERQGILLFANLDRFEVFCGLVATASTGNLHSPASFDFALVEDDGKQRIGDWIKRLLEMRPFLPTRLLVHTSRKREIEEHISQVVVVDDNLMIIQESLRSDHPSHFVDTIWKRWLTRWGKDKIQVWIGLDQSSKLEIPTSIWDEASKAINSERGDLQLYAWSNDNPPPVSTAPLLELGQLVVFDRHSTCRVSHDMPIDGQFFYEAFDKGSPDFQPLFSPNIEKVNKVMRSISPSPYLLTEAGMIKILVVDERITERTHERVGKSRYGAPRGLIAGKAGIWIATHFGIDADPLPIHRQVELSQHDPSFPSFSVRIDTTVDGFRWTLGGKLAQSLGDAGVSFFDIVIFHQGVLETYLKNPQVRQEFLSAMTAVLPLVVVTSGRGIPTDVRQNRSVKFLPFSLLERYVLGSGIAKLRLTSLCMKLTRWSR
jgi:hypothetical protein